MKFLRLLGIPKSAPSLELLKELVKRHLNVVPYENFSKLVRSENLSTIPDFQDYVAGIAERSFGGTCFAQTIHLDRLLSFLGFESRLLGIRRDGEVSHVSLKVRVDGFFHLIDVGLMSSIAGPYRIHPDDAFDVWAGNQRYVFTPLGDLENYRLEIHRDGKKIRAFESVSKDPTDSELAEGIRKSHDPAALFMSTLCVHRVFEDESVGLWNRNLYRVRGEERSVRELASLADMENAFRAELKLPDYPIEQAHRALESKGHPKLF